MVENQQGVIYPISQKEFFKQPQYKCERTWINVSAIFMYISAVAGVFSLAACWGKLHSFYEFVSIMGVPLAVFGVIMGSFILIKKDSAYSGCIASSIIYGFAMAMFAMFDVVVVVILAMAAAFAGSSRYGEMKIFTLYSLILQLFIVILPFVGSLLATVGSLKINNDWNRYKKSFGRMF